MPLLNITNNGLIQSGLSDPATLFFEKIDPGANSFDVTTETLDNLQEQLEQLDARLDSNGDKIFDINVSAAAGSGSGDFAHAEALSHYLANKVNVNTVVSTASAGISTVSVRRADIAAGEAMIDGELFIYAAATDQVGDAELDKDGVDVSAVDLATDEDVWTSFVFVNNGGSKELLLVRGEGVDNTGSDEASNLTDDEIATAVGVHLGASGPVYAFVRIADIEFVESSGLTETIHSRRPAPPQYA